MNKYKNIDNDSLDTLAMMHKGLIKALGLEERFIKGKELAMLMGCNQRKVRGFIEDTLHLYLRGLLPKMIVGTRNGYIYTDDVNIIQPIIKNRVSNFKSIAYNWYHVQKKISNNNNLKLDEFLGVKNDVD